MVSNDVIETSELDEKADKVEKPKDAVAIIQVYKDIICTKKKSMICIMHQQGKVFKKFKDEKICSACERLLGEQKHHYI